MANSDFIDGILAHVDDGEQGSTWRLALPPPRHAAEADMVLSGEGASPEAAAALARHPAVEHAVFVEAARCINLQFATAPLFAAITAWQNEPRPPACDVQPNRDDSNWDNPFYAVQYAHYRAGCVARDRLHWDYDIPAARKLAVATLLFARDMRAASDENSALQRLAAFARIYAEWHETLLTHRAAKFRQTNGELMQKEAIQYPVASALLARAAAIELQCGLYLLNIEPTKEWVA